MKQVFVESILPDTLANPSLSILKEDETLSSVILLQPTGNVLGDKTGIRPGDQSAALSKLKKALEKACRDNSDLVLTPEYFCSWSIFHDIATTVKPPTGALWVLGLQSISIPVLDEFRASIKGIEWIIQDMAALDRGKFINCLAYVFTTVDRNSDTKTVCILQLKTKPMVDTELRLEQTQLALGTDVYTFRNSADGIYLASIICSDALDFDPQAFFQNWKHQPYLLLHPQLNPSPSHSNFRLYRTAWARYPGEKKLVICLNWGRGSAINAATTDTTKFARSVLMTKDSPVFGPNDHAQNHERGLYYAYSEFRVHAFYLDFDEVLMSLKVSKVSRSDVNAASGNLACPKVDGIFSWRKDQWQVADLNDEYSNVCPWAPGTLQVLNQGNPGPIDKEIIIGKSTGCAEGDAKRLSLLDSVKLSAAEDIRRITFVQDQGEDAIRFRRDTLRLFRDFCDRILVDPRHFPANVIRIHQNLRLGIFSKIFNATNSNGDYALLCNIGEVPDSQVEEVFIRYSQIFHSLDERRKYICIWYQLPDGAIKARFEKNVSIRADHRQSPVDITREIQ